MSTIQSQLVCDSSTLTNFKAWAQAISTAFSTFGWSQSSDTGQVNWSSIASVPGSSAYVFEIWQPNDGLTNFYAKVEYGNFSGTNCPTVRVTLGTGTNGSGTLTGFVTSAITANASTFTAPSATTQYECNFSGAAGRFGAMMWRNGANNCQQFFAIERSVNSSGTYTGTHATLYICGWAGGASDCQAAQQSLVFGVGAAPNTIGTNRATSGNGGFQLRCFNQSGLTTSAFNGSIGFDTAAPYVGYFDYPSTVVGTGVGADIVEGVTFSATIYGSTLTYMPGKIAAFAYAGPNNNTGISALCMRFD